MAVSSRATSSGSNARMSTRRGRASSATAHPAPRRRPRPSTHPGFLTPGTLSRRRPALTPTRHVRAPRADATRGRDLDARGCPQPPAFEDNGPVLLDEVAGTSAAVAASSARLAKVERLAACLRRLEPGEVHPAVAFLSGDLRQRQIGVGWAALRDAPDRRPTPA